MQSSIHVAIQMTPLSVKAFHTSEWQHPSPESPDLLKEDRALYRSKCAPVPRILYPLVSTEQRRNTTVYLSIADCVHAFVTTVYYWLLPAWYRTRSQSLNDPKLASWTSTVIRSQSTRTPFGIWCTSKICIIDVQPTNQLKVKKHKVKMLAWIRISKHCFQHLESNPELTKCT